MRTLLPILFFIIFATPSFGLQVSFKKETVVTTDYITLGDLVTFDKKDQLTEALATTIINRSPDPGDTLSLNAISIEKEVYRKTTLSRDTLWTGSSVVTVTRKGQKITADQLIGAIDNYLLKKKRSLPEAEIHFTPRSRPLPFMLPKGKLSIEVTPSNPDILESSHFSLIFRVDGKVEKNISVPGKLQALAPVMIATDSLRRGTILTPTNTAQTLKDLTEYKNPCTNPRRILGKRLKRSVRAHNVILASDVEIPPLVRKGQLVKIILSRGNMYLTATGIARMNGMLNQIIRVRNAQSNKLIYCKVTAPGIVEVPI